MKAIRIATRKSALALAQSRQIAAALEALHPGLRVELVPLVTRGDQLLDTPLHESGGKGLFTKEIDRALQENAADLAVHSLKDLPTEAAEGLCFAAVPPRENDEDVLVVCSAVSPNTETMITLNDIEPGQTIATGSLRRVAQLKRLRPDVAIAPIRGNVDTRIRKLHENGWGGIILAAAGLNRLERFDVVRAALPDSFLPAAGQGALGLVTRESDAETRRLLAPLEDFSSRLRVAAERAFLHALGGGCHAPAGIRSRLRLEMDGGVLHLAAGLFAPDGSTEIRIVVEGVVRQPADAEQLGRQAAREMLSRGGDALLASLEQGA